MKQKNSLRDTESTINGEIESEKYISGADG